MYFILIYVTNVQVGEIYSYLHGRIKQTSWFPEVFSCVWHSAQKNCVISAWQTNGLPRGAVPWIPIGTCIQCCSRMKRIMALRGRWTRSIVSVRHARILTRTVNWLKKVVDWLRDWLFSKRLWFYSHPRLRFHQWLKSWVINFSQSLAHWMVGTWSRADIQDIS